MASSTPGLLDWPIAKGALVASLRKLDPRELLRNPVILSVEVVSVLVTGKLIVDLVLGTGDTTFEIQVAIWLWLTVLFANFAEALAEGRGKAQADALRKTRTTTWPASSSTAAKHPYPHPTSARATWWSVRPGT